MKNETLFYISLFSLFNFHIIKDDMKAKEPSATYYSLPKLNALRNRIKKNIDAIDNPQDLERLLALTERNKETEETPLILSPEMEKELQKGIDDYNNGNYLTQEELNKELKEWIKE